MKKLLFLLLLFPCLVFAQYGDPYIGDGIVDGIYSQGIVGSANICIAEDDVLYLNCDTNTVGFFYSSANTQLETTASTDFLVNGNVISEDGFWMEGVSLTGSDSRVLWASANLVGNFGVGIRVFENLHDGTWNTCVGDDTCTELYDGSFNSIRGADGAGMLEDGDYNTGSGFTSLHYVKNGNYHTHIGAYAGLYDPVVEDINTTIAIGYNAKARAAYQGVLGSGDSNGFILNWYYNDVVDDAPVNVTLNAAGGLGTDISGAHFAIAGGKNTGAGTPGNIVLKTGTTGGSGTTLSSLTTRMTVSESGIESTVPLTVKADSAAYTTFTQADGGGMTFDVTSDGTAAFYLSDPTTITGDLTLDLSVQDYTFTNRSGSVLALQSETSGSNFYFEMFSKDGDGSDIVQYRLWGVGTPGSITNGEALNVQYDPGNAFQIYPRAWGGGTLRPLEIFTYGNTDQIQLNTDGTVTFATGGIKLPINTTDVSNPPTDAELDAIWTSPATVGAGWMQYLDDNNAHTAVYLIMSDGTNWWHFAGTKAL